jgi:hypothetical protein
VTAGSFYGLVAGSSGEEGSDSFFNAFFGIASLQMRA